MSQYLWHKPQLDTLQSGFYKYWTWYDGKYIIVKEHCKNLSNYHPHFLALPVVQFTHTMLTQVSETRFGSNCGLSLHYWTPLLLAPAEMDESPTSPPPIAVCKMDISISDNTVPVFCSDYMLASPFHDLFCHNIQNPPTRLTSIPSDLSPDSHVSVLLVHNLSSLVGRWGHTRGKLQPHWCYSSLNFMGSGSFLVFWSDTSCLSNCTSLPHICTCLLLICISITTGHTINVFLNATSIAFANGQLLGDRLANRSDNSSGATSNNMGNYSDPRNTITWWSTETDHGLQRYCAGLSTTRCSASTPLDWFFNTTTWHR